jgi:hypothetical protein
VKYLILIYDNPETREIWERLPNEEKAKGLHAYTALTEALGSSGELIANSALTDPSRTKQVAVHEGRVTTTDGPFAEVKEFLAGFYLVDVESEQRAVEIAAQVPEAEFGVVEVRATQDLDAFLD